MAKDHYLPASFIGRFSAAANLPVRSRLVYAYDARAGKTIATTPENIGYKKGLYDLRSGMGAQSVDGWSYETQLSRVLDRLVGGLPLTLDDWIHVAVPFVTGLFVRGTEFDKRYEAMPLIKHLMASGLVGPDNTNVSRIMRLQRQLAPVAAARWVVMHAGGSVPLITNNLGMLQTLDLHTREVGWAIPLDTDTILGIFPRKFNGVAYYERDTWQVAIEHRYPARRVFWDINGQTARAATEFIVGPDAGSVSRQADRVGQYDDTALLMEGAWAQVFTGPELAAHESDWTALAAIANANPSPDELMEHDYDLWNVARKDKWMPPILILPSGASPAGNGIVVEDNRLYLSLSLPDDFQPDAPPPGERQAG